MLEPDKLLRRRRARRTLVRRRYRDKAKPGGGVKARLLHVHKTRRRQIGARSSPALAPITSVNRGDGNSTSTLT